MAEITFSSVFAVICDNIQARVKDKIFGEIFYSYLMNMINQTLLPITLPIKY